MAIFTVMGLFGVAYAVPFEADVPFDYQDSGCTLVVDTPDFKQYDCSVNWKSANYTEPGEEYPPSEDGCASGFDVDITTGECKPHEQIKEEAMEEYHKQKALEELAPPTDPRLPKADSNSTTDQELIKKINAVLEGASCYQGIGTTAGIQEVRNFPIPVVEVNGVWVLDLSSPASSVDLKGYLGEIIKHAQECDAQSQLLNHQGGILSSADEIVGYCDGLPNTTTEYNLMCGYNYRDHSVIASDIPVWSQDRVNQEANMGLDLSDPAQYYKDDAFCNGYFSDSTKRAYGCIKYADPETTAPTILKDYHDNPAGLAYEQYLEDGGKAMAEKLAKQAIQDKISELSRQLQALRNQ